MTKCSVDEVSQYNETPLHTACFRGHFEVAKFLVERKEASLSVTDANKNTILHNATSSNNGKLMKWLLSIEEVKARINAKNKVSLYLKTLAFPPSSYKCFDTQMLGGG